MTDEHDAPSQGTSSGTADRHGAGSPRSGGPRRAARGGRDRELLESIEANLRLMRPELERVGVLTREHAGLLSEALPHLGELDTALAGLRGRVQALEGTEEPDDNAGPYDPAALTAAGLLPDPGHQVDWHLMSAEQALPAWEALGAWVATVVCGRLGFTRTQLPDCWALHPDVVAELSWAHQTHRLYAGAKISPAHLAEWHTRWLPHLRARLAALLVVDTLDPRSQRSHRDQPEDFRPRCRPGHYHQLPERLRERVEKDLEPHGANDSTRDAPPRAFEREHGDQSWITGLLARQHSPEPTDQERAARDRRRHHAQAVLDGADPTGPPTGRPAGPPERARYLIAHPGDDRTEIGSPAATRAHPGHWLGYYREAAAADLARRHHREHHGHPRPVDVTLTPTSNGPNGPNGPFSGQDDPARSGPGPV